LILKVKWEAEVHSMGGVTSRREGSMSEARVPLGITCSPLNGCHMRMIEPVVGTVHTW